MATIQFPDNFLWGAATSSYQIEGAHQTDGRGPSIWDTFSHTPGKINDGTNGDIACDHYNRWPDDIKLMQEIGLQSYRFSIAWPRIIPNGTGAVNQAGLDFYSRLVDGLLEAGIQPNATLYHWDLPQALQDQGGWPSRHVVDAYVTYADVVTRHLGDRVKLWATFNEPYVSAYVGYHDGRHAPGHTSREEMVKASHHLLLAHGKAVPVIRANVADATVGMVLDVFPIAAASEGELDQRAAQLWDGRQNRWYLDPLAGRGYPADVVAHYESDMAHVQDGDLEAIAVPIDFLGINYYRREMARDPHETAVRTLFPGDEITEMKWEVHPESLYNTLMRLTTDYSFPALYITENGAALVDVVAEDGQVHDAQRISYLQRHFAAAQQAIEDGAPLKGYYVWSLMDNFEWGHGYTKRFGIIRVDYETQKRTLKDSALWYKSVIAANGFEM